MQKTFTFYNDPGHGWLKAPRTLLENLGIADKVSSYSYQRGADVFLEEDCDATLLVKALRERGIEPKFVDKYSDKSSKIRNYESYQHLTSEQQEVLADLRTRMLACRNWDEKAKSRIRNAGLETLQYWKGVYGF